MAKKEPSKLLDVARGSIDRLQAAKIYFSGELDAGREEALRKGDLPWRILQYKRIVDPDKLGYPIAKMHYTRVETFEKHLRYLSKHCKVVPLDDLVRRIAAGESIPDKTVALTFDGGWVDNFIYAYPLLLRLQVPATFFLSTAFIGTMNYYWQDKILFALIIMKQAGLAFIPFDFISDEHKQLLESVAPGGKVDFPLIYTLISILMFHPAEHRVLALTVLGNLAQQLGGDLPAEPAFMSWDDAKMMQSPLTSFGSLSHSNSTMIGMDAEAIRYELDESKRLLQENLTSLTKVFAFPDGIVPLQALPHMKDFGVECGLGVEGIPKPGTVETPFLLLGRVPIYEGEAYSTETFACKLWLPETQG